MKTTAAAINAEMDDDAQREIALDRAQRVGREYLALRRSLMMKNEGNQMDDLIQKNGKIAEKILELEAKELRKLHPHLTEAQAFAKVYSDPANVDLRKAERQANGFVRYDVEHDDLPVEISKAEAMSALTAKAKELRKSQPELTEAQAFTKVYKANPDLANAERRASRALFGC